ncbi:hypothetical protein [Actinoplanes sp. NPDC048796]|uniref:hypothetical protein n=1 Tax=unclassified Actinoplanes TaxID=2626549 RepID=UPI0033D6D8B2
MRHDHGGQDGGNMADLVKDFLWSGIEDFTGLWDAASIAKAVEGLLSLETARDRARAVLEYLLAEELVDLYVFRGLPQNDAVPVALEQQAGLLRDVRHWSAPGKEDDVSVWFDTTEKGFEWYCELYNGGVLLYRK